MLVYEVLKKLDYAILSYGKGNEKIEGLRFSDDVVLFGPDATVYDLLYKDVLDVTP
ncbi:hypothetical protein ACWOFR_05850 [Carnobacterium gallinarum]|uniref:hypothetical protein n=1 Tax=Carnobacterium gallinarum TaxID=2749 RepID=UPI000ACA9444|nr:hypothetical protein [Carnobacterium gallinarum]